MLPSNTTQVMDNPTASAMSGPDRHQAVESLGLQQPGGGLFHHIEHLLEPLGPAIVGVRHLAQFVLGGEVHEQGELALQPRRADRPQLPIVVPIHRQHIVEALEIHRQGLARPLGA